VDRQQASGHSAAMFDMVLDWEALKEWLSKELHVSHAVLHIHIGLLVFLVMGRVLRKPMSSPLPLLVVAMLELANEAMDFTRYYVSHWPWTPGNTIEDIVNTLLWPTILLLLARMDRAGAVEAIA
jgi:hypothetical protein